MRKFPRDNTFYAGKKYDYDEWVNFLVEPDGEVNDDIEFLANMLAYLLRPLWYSWCVDIKGEELPEDADLWERINDDVSEERLAYLFHMTATGSGVGFWDCDDADLREFGEWLFGEGCLDYWVLNIDNKEPDAVANLMVAHRVSHDLDTEIAFAMDEEGEE